MVNPLDCSGSCIKYIVFLCGFIVFSTGAVILGVGVWVKVDPSIVQYVEVLGVDQNDPLWKTATILLIAVGAIIFVVGFFGCCGAYRESPCLLWMYIAFLIIIFIAEVAAAVLAIVFKNNLLKVLDKSLTRQAKGLVKDKYQKSDSINLAWHAMQVNLKCCGGHSFLDYKDNYHFKEDNPVPKTCCNLQEMNPLKPTPVNLDECYREAKVQDLTPHELHIKNCTKALDDLLISKAAILVASAFVVAIIQILGIVFACCLRKELLGGGSES